MFYNILTVFSLAVFIASGTAKTALVVPLEIDSAQVADYRAYRNLFIEALAMNYPGKLIAAKVGAEDCSDKDCAIRMAKAMRADEVF